MSTESIIQKLAEYFKKQPVLKAWLLGSFSRGEQNDKSNVDILVMPDYSQPVGLDFTKAHNETPWKMVRGMRNYIVHEYFQIDDAVVCDVITNNLPDLRVQIQSYLSDTGWAQWENK